MMTCRVPAIIASLCFYLLLFVADEAAALHFFLPKHQAKCFELQLYKSVPLTLFYSVEDHPGMDCKVEFSGKSGKPREIKRISLKEATGNITYNFDEEVDARLCVSCRSRGLNKRNSSKWTVSYESVLPSQFPSVAAAQKTGTQQTIPKTFINELRKKVPEVVSRVRTIDVTAANHRRREKQFKKFFETVNKSILWVGTLEILFLLLFSFVFISCSKRYFAYNKMI